MEKKVKYPLGIQTFERIIEDGYLYIDKTDLVYQLTHGEAMYLFLSRPRRFGKTLLTHTLRAYFEGRRELFKGLAIEKLEQDWTCHPVVHLDMSTCKSDDTDELNRKLHTLLNENSKRLEIEIGGEDVDVRLTNLIQKAYIKYGQKTVVLIDEYDTPLLDVLHDEKKLERLRRLMRKFFSSLKANETSLRFVFLTGISKFSQLSIFSELNNIKNISMLETYAAICGITHEEMVTQMNEGIEAMAEKNRWTTTETIDALRTNYDGYHFTWPSPDIYNPYSLLNAMSDGKIDDYWFGSGTPTYLIEMLRKYDFNPRNLDEGLALEKQDFDAPTEYLTSIAPLFYQSGYLTIKNYDADSDLYDLCLPNKEVRIGLYNSLFRYYNGQAAAPINTCVARMRAALKNNQMDVFFKQFQLLLGTIPYADHMDEPTRYEAHWQQILYITFTLLGARADVEVRTPTGRVDLVARTQTHLYLLELKLNDSPEAAMNQIDLKNYPERFALCGLPIIKIGAQFSRDTRNIVEWMIEEQKR